MNTQPLVDKPVNRIHHLLHQAPPDSPKDSAELARERATVLDIAIIDAIRTMQDLLESPDGKTRFAAATAILDLKKASLRHKTEVFEEPFEPVLPPLQTPAEIAAADAAEREQAGEEEEQEEPPPPAPKPAPAKPKWEHGIPGMTRRFSAQLLEHLGPNRFDQFLIDFSKYDLLRQMKKTRELQKLFQTLPR